jgi:hypothetical protein
LKNKGGVILIIDFILNIVSNLIGFILNLLPVLDIGNIGSTFNGFQEWINELFYAIQYFLPLQNLLLIFGLSLAVTHFRLTWSIIKKVYGMVTRAV